MNQISSAITGGVTMTAAGLAPIILWAINGFERPVPDNVPLIIASLLVTVFHLIVNRINVRNSSTVTKSTGSVPALVDKQAGSASLSFLMMAVGIITLIGALVMSGCATDPLTMQRQYVDSCAAYEAAFKTVNTLDSQSKLTASEISTVLKVDKITTPLCEKMPADLIASVTQITQATTTLTVQIIADKVSKK